MGTWETRLAVTFTVHSAWDWLVPCTALKQRQVGQSGWVWH